LSFGRKCGVHITTPLRGQPSSLLRWKGPSQPLRATTQWCTSHKSVVYQPQASGVPVPLEVEVLPEHQQLWACRPVARLSPGAVLSRRGGTFLLFGEFSF